VESALLPGDGITMTFPISNSSPTNPATAGEFSALDSIQQGAL